MVQFSCIFFCAAIVPALRVMVINICITTADAAQCLFMKATYAALKACMHIGIGPFVKPGELIISYCAILFSSHAFHFATLKHTWWKQQKWFP